MTYPLTMNLVVQLARMAYDNGQLQAQNRVDRSISCKYTGPCAIGIALPPELRQIADQEENSFIDALTNRGIISFPNKDELADAKRLQTAHDKWHGAKNQADREARLNEPAMFTIAETEAEFIATLINLEAKYT